MGLSSEEKLAHRAEAQRKYGQKTKYAAQARYNREETKNFSMRFSKKDDYIVIAKLESVANRTDYIRNLILQDIASHS